jgi:hypothetical protein
MVLDTVQVNFLNHAFATAMRDKKKKWRKQAAVSKKESLNKKWGEKIC